MVTGSHLCIGQRLQTVSWCQNVASTDRFYEHVNNYMLISGHLIQLAVFINAAPAVEFMGTNNEGNCAA